MTIKLKQSTASQEIPLGYFVDSTDGNTEETGLTIANTDIKLWKSGATTLANKNSGGATHISNGIYYAVLDATDTDTLGPLVIFVHVSGALPVRLECEVLSANVYDSLVGGTDYLQTDVQQVEGSDATDQIRDAVVDDATRIDASALNTAAAAVGSDGSGLTEAGGTGDHLTAVPWNAAWDAEVQSEVTDALNAYDPPTATEMTAAFTEIKGGTWSAATDTLEAIRDRGDAAWITATGFSTHDAAAVRSEMDANSTQLAAIVADTNELQTDDVPGLIAALNDFDPTTDTVDVGAISGDETAADNLEAILDGTGATLTLDKLLVQANDPDGGIEVTNSAGPGIKATSSEATGPGMMLVGGNYGGHGMLLTGGGYGYGLKTEGLAGLSCEGSMGGAVFGGGAVDSFGLALFSNGVEALRAVDLGDDSKGRISADLDGTVNGIAGTIQTLDALDTAQDAQHAATQADIAALNNVSAIDVADEVLTRDWTAVSGEADRSALNALRSLRNKVAVDSGTLTVYEEDDSTPAWTGAVTTASSADPITEVDPA